MSAVSLRAETLGGSELVKLGEASEVGPNFGFFASKSLKTAGHCLDANGEFSTLPAPPSHEGLRTSPRLIFWS